MTDHEIEVLALRYGRWDGSRWVIEDADLHPFARAILEANSLGANALGVPASPSRSPSQAPAIADATCDGPSDEERVRRALALAEEYAADCSVAMRTDVVSDINAANRKWRELDAAIRACIPARAPKPLDDPHLQQVFGWAIDGAMASGYQNTNPAPGGHWLAYWWQKGRDVALREGSEPKATTEGRGVEPAEPGDAPAARAHLELGIGEAKGGEA